MNYKPQSLSITGMSTHLLSYDQPWSMFPCDSLICPVEYELPLSAEWDFTCSQAFKVWKSSHWTCLLELRGEIIFPKMLRKVPPLLYKLLSGTGHTIPSFYQMPRLFVLVGFPYRLTRWFLTSYLQWQLKQALKAVSTLRKILMLLHSPVSMAVGVTLVQVATLVRLHELGF